MTPARADRRCHVAILISGSGTNLQSFIDRVAAGELHADIVQVVSNKADAFGLQRAQKAGIGATCIEHGGFPNRESFDRAVAQRLDPFEPDLIVLAGFMRILSPWFVHRYEGRILNIHPALLPKHPGLDTHKRAIAAGDAHHGSTVHFVTEELDGGPRILAGRVTIAAGETDIELKSRVQAVEHQIYPQAAEWFASNRLRYRDGVALLDGEELHEPVVIDFN